MTDSILKQIEEHVVEGKRLGRHVEHDPRSRNFAYEKTTPSFKTVMHRRYGSLFDQGQIGSCTGNAMAGAVNTSPVHKRGTRTLGESNAVDLYELATVLDGIPGQYPPDDTGSSGLAVAKAAQQKGYISAYQHAFDITAALSALQESPIIVGVNWYEGLDNPASDGLVAIAGSVRGGHEFLIRGFHLRDNLLDSYVMADNSWGTSWGDKGHFHFTVSTLEQLLAEQGDATILVP